MNIFRCLSTDEQVAVVHGGTGRAFRKLRDPCFDRPSLSSTMALAKHI